MKKIKKTLKIVSITLIIIFSLILIGSISYYTFTTHSISLDQSKLNSFETNTLKIYDSNLEEIKPTTKSYIPISKLSSKTISAFISAEDKRFYSHNGLDYKRIAGAIVSNIKTKSFSQGASTISQQLIKNTQLSNEKTINRKLKEIKLTRELENKYSKSEILEMYLNNIYFGNGCYGIENAAEHYFGKSSTDLSLSESALLAGTINAPSVYDIENNFEKANERKNLILSLMHKYGKISNEEFESATLETPELNLSKISSDNFLYSQIINEAHSILKLPENSLNNSSYKIYTHINKSFCDEINKITDSYTIESNPNKLTIVINNKTHGIVSITGKSKTLTNKWQPGSTIKPILVYAPAIESGQISPATKILDSKINISGYAPNNADKKFHGYVSAREALSKSYNIPAVKILNEYGIANAQNFANKLGITFSEKDTNLSIALGGFTEGITPKTLCDAYTAFATGGNFQPSSYISKITKDDKIIYSQKQNKNQVMKDSTAYLITNMLFDSAKTGTAKRLSGLNFEVASKTGTVGKSNSTKNICAYNIAYTSSHTVLTLICGDDMPETINGSTYPTMISKDILSSLYKTKQPKNFTVPKSVLTKEIDFDSYTQKNQIKQVQDDSKTKIIEYFSNDNKPNEIEQDLFKLSVINTPKTKPILCFTLNKKYDFFVIKTQKKEEKIIFSSLKNEQNFVFFEDKTAKKNEIAEYKIKFCEKTTNEEFYSNSIKIRVF